MTESFVDASYFIALLNPRDIYHSSARRLAVEHPDSLVTTAWILAEVGNYFSRPVNRGLFLELLELIEQNARMAVIAAGEESFDAGVDVYRSRPDKDWSFVDCISFAVMQQRGITEALTADHHFEQAGFRILLK